MKTVEQLRELDKEGKLLGAFDDIENDVYHNNLTPGISSTRLKLIGESFSKYRYETEVEKKTSKAMDFGSALHDYILLPDYFKQNYTIGKKTAGTVISSEDMDKIKCMSDVVMRNDDINTLITGCKKELSHWCYLENTLCKFRTDLIDINKGIIIDLKTTTNSNEISFSKAIHDYGYDLSSAFYCDGAKEVYKKNFLFAIIAIEKTPPYELGLYVIGEDTINKGREKYINNLSKYKMYIQYKLEGKINQLEHKSFKIINMPYWALKDSTNDLS